MRKFLLLFLTILSLNRAQSQQIFNEDFNDSANTTISLGAWTQIGATATNPIKISTGSLSSPNYVLSGIGNKIQLNSSGQDVYRDARLSRSSGTLYTSFMVNVTTAGTGDYFMGLLPQSSTTTFTGRIYIRAASGGFYRIGISKGSITQAAIETTTYSSDSFAFNTDQLFVLKYQFISGATNDSVFLYSLANGMETNEPNQALIATKGGTNTDPTSLGRIFLRQGATASSPSLFVDGIRMGLSWSDLNQATIMFPKPVSALNMNSTTSTSIQFNWSKPADYNDSSMTTLVFLKRASAIVQGTATLNPSSYLANNDFSQNATMYENDTLAKCVYKGDGNNFTVIGLNPQTTYHALVFVVKDSDTLYSLAITSSLPTLSTTPAAITGLTFTANAQNEAIISWTKAGTYSNPNHTIVVFMKQGAAITTGLNRNTNPNKINADSNFLGNGSKFQNDTNARCVYKGDGSLVNVIGLAYSTNYFMLVYVINDADSAYSTGAATSGLSSSSGPLSVLSLQVLPLESGKLKIKWSKNTDYSDTDYTTLVYLKKTSAIRTGTNNLNPNFILADSNYLSGSKLPSDTLAMCVFNGDQSEVTVSNLVSANAYYALVYVVRTADSSYSNSSASNGTVRSLPVSNIVVNGLTASTANISWTTAPGYINTGFNTLVFVKKDNPINLGTPTRTTTSYAASSTVGFGTSYQHDASAYCVYKGDLSTVNISGLSNQSVYHVLIYIVRDADSTYSEGAIGSGSSMGIPPVYKIEEMNHVDMVTGVPDSLGKRATLRGIVYGNNQATNGLRFTIRDETGGIVVLSTNKTFSYSPKEGDSIEVQGSITVSSGLTQISTLDTIINIAGGKQIKSPIELNEKLNESHESDLVSYQKISFINVPTGGVWLRNSLVNCRIHNSNDTLVIRILNNSSLAGKAIPNTATFNVKGIVSQVSSSNTAPFPFNGYQLILRDSNDISTNPDTLSPFALSSPMNNTKLNLSGAGSQSFLFSWSKSNVLIGTEAVSYLVKISNASGDFSLPLFNQLSGNNGADTFLLVSYEDLANSLQLVNGDSLSFKWTVTAISMGAERWANQKWNLICVRGLFTGLSKAILENQISIYPNPSKDEINIYSNLTLQSVEVYDQKGSFVQTLQINDPNNIKQIPSGLYILKLKTDNAVLYRKFIKE